MAFAQGEKLHGFAGEIFVGMLFAALRLVEPDEHGRIGGDGFEQIEPVARAELAEGIDLAPHEIGFANFDDAGGEVAVPEEGEFLLQWSRPVGHALQPHGAHLQKLERHVALELLL